MRQLKSPKPAMVLLDEIPQQPVVIPAPASPPDRCQAFASAMRAMSISERQSGETYSFMPVEACTMLKVSSTVIFCTPVRC